MSYIGLDIAKLSFVACVRQQDKSTTHSFDNHAEGFGKLQEWLSTFGLTSPHYCVESTGKYGLALADFLHTHGEKVL